MLPDSLIIGVQSRHVQCKAEWEKRTSFVTWSKTGQLNTIPIVKMYNEQPCWNKCVLECYSAHQTHYEQFGKLSGQVQIEGYSDQTLTVFGVRDHSYGNIRSVQSNFNYGRSPFR